MNKNNEAPKDFADKSGLLVDERWNYENKESYGQIAKYLLFIIASAGFGFILMLGILS